MGGVFSQLMYMLVQHRCSPSSVANSLTFVPPEPPFYKLVTVTKDDGTNELEVQFSREVIFSPFPVGIKVVMLRTGLKNMIPGFLYAHPQATKTILYSHGNAADCGMLRERYIQLCNIFKVNVFGYDYSGYGEASGSPSERNTYADIEAAYDWLAGSSICSDPGRKIVLYGQSVGSGPSVFLASSRKRPVCGLILHSPIMSGIRVLMENRGPLACCDIYPNINRIKKVKCPVLVIHGDRDIEVGFNHGVGLQAAVPKENRTEPCWIKGAGHNNIVDEFPHEYYPKVHAFLNSLGNNSTGVSNADANTARSNEEENLCFT